ncbi:1-acyl-sn-glycerol-3-phosphate acyltransferase alpha-like [Schistocerca serialis cubense]|uniref:1-acyl-sn-glycerol-3-phosphate acyltransferase alpha-like n=1 Tax=Schistocerca serialis cubense TaxID=2023355 RepID=UPI00214F513D|nr:1-acyl-sn-glycerol-3-phosphate acyltransferase alpha-like [Schistocerca serialis cubense]XP_049954240.1 1-acyl-sn-glycerol-3-phosphate acyltransferase alpha-like [Schistocerca serialis cubense]XP_049954241.1 1-acyl-sn-glycerol-3-phosphate acyltransferase alpha-like [Schistocerca serialis cubense]
MTLAGYVALAAAAVLILLLLWYVSNSCRYYVKFTVFLLLSLFFGSVFIPLMLFRPRDWRNALLPAWGARQISKILGIKFHLRGLDNVVTDSGCVVVINHQSCLDLLVLAELWPKLKRCTVISKKEVFYLWPFGLAAWLWGTIYINRLNVEQAQAAINSTADTIKNGKMKLCMFPEGTRNNGPTLLPFKKGAFHVAIASQTPVQPVVVTRYYFLESKEKIFNPGKAVITILPPIDTTGLKKEDVGSLVERTRELMLNVHTLSTELLLQNIKNKDM